MELLWLVDVGVFVAFIVAVVAVGIGMSRHETDSEGYFLAGRGLRWYLIGFSLIAANISTEQFVGQSGQAAMHVGLAIASFEWLAAVTLVIVAFFFLPAFLRAGIYTIPEFLEHRFNHHARSIMSLLMMLTYMFVTLPAVIYSGAITGETVFGENKLFGLTIDVSFVAWTLGVLAAVYVVAGGLKACAWADLLQGSALMVGGAIVLVLAMNALADAPAESLEQAQVALAGDAAPGVGAAELARTGAWERFTGLNGGKLHMVLPSTDKLVPWTALVLGLWIPNLYYWGLNQYIMQRTLGSQSLAQGQKGVVFAAGLKLLIPFIIIFPGMIAFNLYHEDMRSRAAERTNRAPLEAFEKAKADPAGAKVAFRFDEPFARLNPDTAAELLAFNARVAGEPAPQGAAPAPANEKLLEAIQKRNAAQPTQRVEVQQELVGYQYDYAFGLLLKKLVPVGLFGFILAAILGAVTSTLAAMLNAASTIFTMDLYKQYVNPGASQPRLVAVGRVSVVALMVIGCLIAPLLGNPKFKGIFTFIQEFQGFISPGILGVFLYGLFVPRAPRLCGVVGLLLSPAAYGLLMLVVPHVAWLDRLAISFFIVMAALAVLTLVRPLAAPVVMPQGTTIDLSSSTGAKLAGAAVIAATAVLYAIFW